MYDYNVWHMALSRSNDFGISQKISQEITDLHSIHQRPIVVAIDGGSGSGKSTLAKILAEHLQATLIPMDDFYAADIPDHHWDNFSIEERFQRSFDWDRLRQDVIQPLREGQPAHWYAFDFVSGLRADGTYGVQTKPKHLDSNAFILIDGQFSASPQLSDLVDYTILVDVPVKERHTRTAAREDPTFLARWHQLWDPVEEYYHNQLRPRETYDLVLIGSGGLDPKLK
jgi:para-aminobenzoate synthetase